jgi:hypothetical protein
MAHLPTRKAPLAPPHQSSLVRKTHVELAFSRTRIQASPPWGERGNGELAQQEGTKDKEGRNGERTGNL